MTGASALADLPLFSEPTAFELFQAVRILARAQPDRERVGYFGDPAREIARFGANPDSSFPAAEIQGIALDDHDGPPRLTVNVMGLNGPLGTLPLVYTQLIAARLREGDPTLRAFVDLFNHRLISLFYRAWEKHRLAVGYETRSENRLGEHLADLVGLGTKHLRERLSVSQDSVLSFAGLFASQRSAVALEELLSEYFSVTAVVEQFVGGWHALERDSCTAIGEEDGPATQLGVGAVVGDEIWDPQSRIRVRLGPLSRAQYDRFLPGGEAHQALRAVVRLFADDQVEVEAQLVLAAGEVSGCVLGADDSSSSRLAWGTWLRTKAMTRDPDETFLSL
ncbi:MAG: type VI secretion system baseplate subunit TssG [Gemmatimonadales bacterium]